MTERPILFSGAMVRALLDGSKTQTRRALRVQPTWSAPTESAPGGWNFSADGIFLTRYTDLKEFGIRISWGCPYGLPGDRLWVRETWRGVVEISPPGSPIEYGVARYVPDQPYCRRVEYSATQERDGEPWRPSIHMPRWASRLLLEITGVRVERLQDISESDARAEGIVPNEVRQFAMFGASAVERAAMRQRAAVDQCREVWESINGAGSWDANPWVWVVEFRRIEA